MNCEQAQENLGPYVDGELAPDACTALEVHLEDCDTCRAELATVRKLASDLAPQVDTLVPENLWTAIEQRLDEAGEATPPTARRPRWRVGRAPYALAAAVVFAVGLSLVGLVWTGSSAHASTVDFSVLLNGLPLDANQAFGKFLALYDAREGSLADARQYAPDLSFDIPDLLPGGFHLQAIYLLRFGKLEGVAAAYDRDGEFLGAVFHRPVAKEHFGQHKDYPCVVGKHDGHKVSVGAWRLVHLTDPTTCHCVLSRLDERTELPDVMAAVAPALPEGTGRHGH